MHYIGIERMETYTVTSHGTIQNPGRFEGEEPWVVAAYYDHLDGGWEDEGDFCYAPITPGDRRQFPDHKEMQAGDFLTLEISDAGFVHGRIVSRKELHDILARNPL